MNKQKGKKSHLISSCPDYPIRISLSADLPPASYKMAVVISCFMLHFYLEILIKAPIHKK